MQEQATPLMFAVMMGHTDCVRLLIDGGANKEATEKVCVCRCFLLWLIFKFVYVCRRIQAGCGSFASVILLYLSMRPGHCICGTHGGGGVHFQLGSTALRLAASSGRIDSLRLLINAGANKDAQANVRVLVCTRELYL
jgi:ankyrin repeat protein